MNALDKLSPMYLHLWSVGPHFDVRVPVKCWISFLRAKKIQVPDKRGAVRYLARLLNRVAIFMDD